MGRKVRVAPEVLASKAEVLGRLSEKYKVAYARVYSEVDRMKAGWRGADNDAYTRQIEGFRHDFEDMATLMAQCAGFLRSSAEAYSKVQDDIHNRASGL